MIQRKQEDLQWVRQHDNFSLLQCPIFKFDQIFNQKWIVIILNACICMFSLKVTYMDGFDFGQCLILKFDLIPNWKWIVMTLNACICIFSLKVTYMDGMALTLGTAQFCIYAFSEVSRLCGKILMLFHFSLSKFETENLTNLKSKIENN